MSYSRGQDAAVEALAEIAENGGDMSSVIDFVNEILHDELEKTASEEDVDVKRGVDSVMFDFMKCAAELVGSYDVSEMDSHEVLGAVLYSMAEEYGAFDDEEWDMDKEAAESSMNTGDLLPVSNYMKPRNAENSHHVNGKSQPSRFNTAKSKISEAFGKSVSTNSSFTTKRMA